MPFASFQTTPVPVVLPLVAHVLQREVVGQGMHGRAGKALTHTHANTHYETHPASVSLQLYQAFPVYIPHRTRYTLIHTHLYPLFLPLVVHVQQRELVGLGHQELLAGGVRLLGTVGGPGGCARGGGEIEETIGESGRPRFTHCRPYSSAAKP